MAKVVFFEVLSINVRWRGQEYIPTVCKIISPLQFGFTESLQEVERKKGMKGGRLKVDVADQCLRRSSQMFSQLANVVKLIVIDV